MKQIRLLWFSGFAFLLIISSLFYCKQKTSPNETEIQRIEKIVFLYTNDRHFDLNLQPEFAGMINQYKSQYDDVFLVDAGDVFVKNANCWSINGGMLLDTVWYGMRAMEMIEQMNKLGYNLLTLGNHELAYIGDYTQNALRTSQFPLLAANISINTDKLPEPEPYAFLTTSNNHKIAVLGLSTDNTKREGIMELNLDSVVNSYLWLKDSSDVFIALTHIGLKNDEVLAKKFPEFDAIIGGHSHDLLLEPVYVNSVIIVQAGGSPHSVSDEHKVYLGELILTLECGKITQKSSRVIEIK